MAKQAFVVGSLSFGFLGSVSIVVPSIVLGVLFLGLFVLWQRQREKNKMTPLVSLSLFKNTVFVRGALIVAILSLGQAGIGFALPVFFQGVLKLSALQTGIAMLPMSLSLLVVSLVSAYVAKFFTPKRIIQFGLVVNAIGFFALSLGVGADTNQWALVPGFILFGIGMGLLFSQASNMTLSAVPVTQSGEAAGVNGTLRQLGASLGSSIMGAILLSSLGANLVAGVQASTVIPDTSKPAISQMVQSQASNIEFTTDTSPAGTGVSPAITTEVEAISKQATVDASRDTLLYGIIFIVLAFILSIRLPNKKQGEAPAAAARSAAH